MIVVVGIPGWRPAEPAAPAGRTCAVALAAARAGARVEVIGRIGDDAAGDALLIALAQAGVGHAAMLRDPVRATPLVAEPPPDDRPETAAAAPNTRPGAGSEMPVPGPRLEPEDVELGLRYVAGHTVLVVVDDVPPDALPVALEAAAYGGAHLVLLLPSGAEVPDATPPGSTVLAAPDDRDDEAFANLVGAYAAAIDAGTAPAEAFASAAAAAGWEALAP